VSYLAHPTEIKIVTLITLPSHAHDWCSSPGQCNSSVPAVEQQCNNSVTTGSGQARGRLLSTRMRRWSIHTKEFSTRRHRRIWDLQYRKCVQICKE
jgi:hypothetical protein